jgi:hypothetical protein
MTHRPPPRRTLPALDCADVLTSGAVSPAVPRDGVRADAEGRTAPETVRGDRGDNGCGAP